jgi:ABC-type branched-subunit amino acid transport system ATPase component
LDDVNMDVMPGAIHAVIGPNGSGKTTLFNVVSGVYRPNSGTVHFGGTNVTGASPERLANLGLGRTFQNTRLFPSMSVLDNVDVVRHRRGSLFRFSEAEHKKAAELLDFVGLGEFARQSASSLPQGQRRLLEIARVLALDPKIVLLDEPHGGLSERETEQLIVVIGAINRAGKTVVLIEHEMEVVMRLAHRITVLNFGKVLSEGTPEFIQHDDNVIEAYLGTAAPTIQSAAAQSDTGDKPLLSVKELTCRYGDIVALRDINLDVHKGEIVTVLGNNGAGKSTLLKSICGLLPEMSGDIIFDGRSIALTPTEKLSRMGIALVPERRRLFSGMSVIDNLKVGAFRRPSAEIERATEEVMDLFPGLSRLSKSLAFSLSGGEQQMLAIGRALMSQPRLLLLDEPSLGLAPKLIEQVFSKLAGINRRGTAILLVEQNANMALAIAHRAYVLGSGSVAVSGDAAALAHDDRVRNAYLGVSGE